MFRNLLIKPLERANILTYVPRRTAKYESPIIWERPEKVPTYAPQRSGDLKPLKDIDMKNTLLPLFDKSKELQTADDNVRKLFTLEFQTRDVLINSIRQDYMDSVKKHYLDSRSPEAVIAAKTASIRHLQKYIETVKGRRPPRSVRVRIKELVEQRAKWLRALRFQDYRLFEWLLERLDLVHKPLPPNGVERVERKKSLRKLTDIYCETLRQEKLDQYRDQLELQHEEFLEKKMETLRWIQDKEREYNLRISVTDEEIESVGKQLEEVKLQKKVQVE